MSDDAIPAVDRALWQLAQDGDASARQQLVERAWRLSQRRLRSFRVEEREEIEQGIAAAVLRAIASGVQLHSNLDGLLEWRADVNNRAFQQLFFESCPAPEGCREIEYTDEMESRQFRHSWYRGLGYGALAASGAAMIGGLVLVYMNRPHESENPERQRLVRVSMTPLVTPDTSGLMFNLSF